MSAKKVSQGELFVEERRFICQGCLQDLPASQFHKNRAKPSGYHPRCRGCRATDREEQRARMVEEAASRGKSLCNNCCRREVPAVGVTCDFCHDVRKRSRVRRTYEKRQVGQCYHCTRPAKEGFALCDSCLTNRDRYRRRHYAKRKHRGVCVRCNNKPMEGHTVCEEHYARDKADGQARRDALKDAAFMAYGGYRCVCCDETEREFLQLDHVRGGGNQHRKRIAREGTSLYVWLRDNGYPPGLLRVLCANCNWACRGGRICPHQRWRMEEAARSRTSPDGAA